MFPPWELRICFLNTNEKESFVSSNYNIFVLLSYSLFHAINWPKNRNSHPTVPTLVILVTLVISDKRIRTLVLFCIILDVYISFSELSQYCVISRGRD